MRQRERLIGFVLAHSSERIALFGGEVYVHMKETQKRPFVVVRQIAIDPEFSNRGCGRKLYEFLAERAKATGGQHPTLAGFIWKRPSNHPRERHRIARRLP